MWTAVLLVIANRTGTRGFAILDRVFRYDNGRTLQGYRNVAAKLATTAKGEWTFASQLLFHWLDFPVGLECSSVEA